LASAQKSEPRVRSQVVTPRASRRISKGRSRKGASDFGKIMKNAAAFAKPAGVMVIAATVILAYNAVASSRLFELRHIEVGDAGPGLRSDVEQVVRRAVGQTRLLDIDLSAVRQKVEALPRVRAATVARVLPDGLFVRVIERRPAVLVRRESGALVWLDDEGAEMGEMSDLKAQAADWKHAQPQEVPPIAKGFAEGSRSQAALAEDRERIALYKQMEKDFGAAPEPLWGLIDQIDLSFPRDVNVRLAHPPVMVHLGSGDFRNRFETALKILSAIREKNSELLSRYRVQDPDRLVQNAENINFIDAARPERIVLNFSTPGTEKAVRQDKK
jgi:hypothetical protein